MSTIVDRLRELGLDGFTWSSALAERVELEGEHIDISKTLARLRMELEFYDRNLGEMREFSQKWGAPMDEVTDHYDEYRLMSSLLGQAIKKLELISDPGAPPA